MTSDNAQQIEDWNGPLGQRWVEFQDEFDRFTQPFSEAALKAAAVRPGEHVIDVGCGCGGSTLALARQVGPEGTVSGIDVSRPMLDQAKRRAAAANLTNVSFSGDRRLERQAADGSGPAVFTVRGDVLCRARAGVRAPAAVAEGQSLKNGGRLAFVCWRAPRDNPWAMLPLVAAREAVGVTPPKSDPLAPGPFAFADETRVRAILLEANFRDVEAERSMRRSGWGTTWRVRRRRR